MNTAHLSVVVKHLLILVELRIVLRLISLVTSEQRSKGIKLSPAHKQLVASSHLAEGGIATDIAVA